MDGGQNSNFYIFICIFTKQICIQDVFNDWKYKRLWNYKHGQDLKTLNLVKDKDTSRINYNTVRVVLRAGKYTTLKTLVMEPLN